MSPDLEWCRNGKNFLRQISTGLGMHCAMENPFFISQSVPSYGLEPSLQLRGKATYLESLWVHWLATRNATADLQEQQQQQDDSLSQNRTRTPASSSTTPWSSFAKDYLPTIGVPETYSVGNIFQREYIFGNARTNHSMIMCDKDNKTENNEWVIKKAGHWNTGIMVPATHFELRSALLVGWENTFCNRSVSILSRKEWDEQDKVWANRRHSIMQRFVSPPLIWRHRGWSGSPFSIYWTDMWRIFQVRYLLFAACSPEVADGQTHFWKLERMTLSLQQLRDESDTMHDKCGVAYLRCSRKKDLFCRLHEDGHHDRIMEIDQAQVLAPFPEAVARMWSEESTSIMEKTLAGHFLLEEKNRCQKPGYEVFSYDLVPDGNMKLHALLDVSPGPIISQRHELWEFALPTFLDFFGLNGHDGAQECSSVMTPLKFSVPSKDAVAKAFKDFPAAQEVLNSNLTPKTPQEFTPEARWNGVLNKGKQPNQTTSTTSTTTTTARTTGNVGHAAVDGGGVTIEQLNNQVNQIGHNLT
ncbi:unnamed protein product [Amoebophrya sp. A25]|nr:unnamed protein product [Amoebophrya sp. A25]|eukprot:GSA25T00021355001.1